MKKLLIILFFAPMLLLSQAININNQSADFSGLSSINFDKIQNTIRIAYQHTSHGSQLVTGITALGSYNSKFVFDFSGFGFHKDIFFNDYGIPGADDLGHNGDLNWFDATETLLSNPECDRNVIMWSWCGGCSDNTEAGINKYLDAMNELEKKYPNVVFVYMTGHLDGTGLEGNLNKMNNIIRDYCTKYNKVLFDFADIESFSPDKDRNFLELKADDACNYIDNGEEFNWAEQWLTKNPNSELAAIASSCESCAHSTQLNCVRKGIATWKLLQEILEKRIPLLSVEDDQDTNKVNRIEMIKPNPIQENSTMTVVLKLKEKASIILDVFDVHGNKIKAFINSEILPEGSTDKVFDLDKKDFPSGKYELRLIVGTDVTTRSFVVVK